MEARESIGALPQGTDEQWLNTHATPWVMKELHQHSLRSQQVAGTCQQRAKKEQDAIFQQVQSMIAQLQLDNERFFRHITAQLLLAGNQTAAGTGESGGEDSSREAHKTLQWQDADAGCLDLGTIEVVAEAGRAQPLGAVNGGSDSQSAVPQEATQLEQAVQDSSRPAAMVLPTAQHSTAFTDVVPAAPNAASSGEGQASSAKAAQPSNSDETIHNVSSTWAGVEPLGATTPHVEAAPTATAEQAPSRFVAHAIGPALTAAEALNRTQMRRSMHPSVVRQGGSMLSSVQIADANDGPSKKRTAKVAPATERAQASLQIPPLGVPEEVASNSGIPEEAQDNSDDGRWQEGHPPSQKESMLGPKGDRPSPDDEDEVERRVFVNGDALKERVRHALLRKRYDVKAMYGQGLASSIAKSSAFELITLGVVAINAIWLWIEVDYNDATVLSEAHPVFQIAEHAFCTYFTFELFIRFSAFEQKRAAFSDGWFLLDSCLVAMMILETWIMSIIFAWFAAGSNEGLGIDASVLKLFRMIRLTRMARMVRLLRWMPEMLILLKGLWLASRSVFFTLLLLLMTIYVFALIFRQLTDDTNIGELYFASIPDSMLSLLLRGTWPDFADWVYSIGEEHLVFAVMLTIFILFASLTVMNMLVGVLVEVVAMVSQIENETMMVNMVRSKMLHMIQLLNLDADGNGTISKEEFEQLLVLPQAAQFLQSVGVDVVGLVEFSEYLFKTKELEFGEFVELILQLRGTNSSTVKDVIDMRKQVMLEMDRVGQQLDGIMGYMHDVSNTLEHVHEEARDTKEVVDKMSAKQAGFEGQQEPAPSPPSPIPPTKPRVELRKDEHVQQPLPPQPLQAPPPVLPPPKLPEHGALARRADDDEESV